MTPIEHKLPSGTLLFQEVGNDAKNFEIKSTSIGKPDQLAHNVHWAYGIYITNQRLIVLPQGDWQLLGLSTELTEQQLSEVMPTTLMHQKHKVTNYKYKSYEDGFLGFPTSIESFNSLKVSLNVIDVEIECNNQWCNNGVVDESYGENFYCSYCEGGYLEVKKYVVLIKRN